MTYIVVNCLLAHPIALIAVILAAVVAFFLWFAKPFTWRDGEGSPVKDDNDNSWWLGRLFPLFPW